ncbi:Probable calcium-binding protein CML15 [Linum grandiflorum]
MAKMGHPLSYKELSEMINHAYTNGDSVLSFHQFATSQIHR